MSVRISNTQIKFKDENGTYKDVNAISPEIPVATSTSRGVVKAGASTVINSAGAVEFRAVGPIDVKGGTSYIRALTPEMQHASAFYGLAKAAGVDMASSSNAVGEYTDDAKIAIQKMLGIYEAPWELIREDTFTNETEADHIITVDGDGNPFELTDIRLLFELPKVDAVAKKGYYGQVWFYYTDSNKIVSEPGAWSRTSATDYAMGTWYFVDYANKMVMITNMSATTNTNNGTLKRRYVNLANEISDSEMGIKIFDDFSIKKINIKSVTGTGQYKLYGRRKWN